MPARVSLGSGAKAPMMAMRQRQTVLRDVPNASAARRHESGCGAAIMSRNSAATLSGRCTRASGVLLRPDEVAPQPEQRHRCAQACVRPHPDALAAPTVWARCHRSPRLGAGIDLDQRLGPFARLGHQPLRLPQLMGRQTGKHAAELGRIEAGHGGLPGMQGNSNTNRLAKKNTDGANTVF